MKPTHPAPNSNGLESSRVAVRTCSAAIAVVVTWFALALQFYLMVIQSHAQGAARVRLMANYFSFFTILTNLLVAVGLTLSLATPHSRLGRLFSRPVVASGTAVYIAIVGVTYSLLLRSLWNPSGSPEDRRHSSARSGASHVRGVLADFCSQGFVALERCSLLVALSAALFLLLADSRRGSRVVSLSHASKLGYSRVLANAAMLVCAFLAVALLVVAIGRWMGRNTPLGHRGLP